jgi:hypothetical protein
MRFITGKVIRSNNIAKMPTGIGHGTLFSLPVLGNLGAGGCSGATTTVADAISVAVMPLALPLAVAVFVVDALRFTVEV